MDWISPTMLRLEPTEAVPTGEPLGLILHKADLLSDGQRESIVKAVAAVDKCHYDGSTKLDRKKFVQRCGIDVAGADQILGVEI